MGKKGEGLDIQTDNGMCVEGTASLHRSVDYTHIYIQSVHILHLTTLIGCFCQEVERRKFYLLCSSGPSPLSWLVGGLCTGLNSMIYEWVKLHVWSRGGTVSTFFIVISQQQLIYFSWRVKGQTNLHIKVCRWIKLPKNTQFYL